MQKAKFVDKHSPKLKQKPKNEPFLNQNTPSIWSSFLVRLSLGIVIAQKMETSQNSFLSVWG